MNRYLRFVLKYIFPLIALIGILGVSACAEGSPYPEDMWTRNIYPGLPNTYNVGSEVYPYHEGHFTELFLNGRPFTSGIVSATWVVAASDSRDANRADLTCDGVQDDVEINTALTSCPPIGGRVILLEGNYNTTQNILVSANCTLEGQGWSTVINANGAAITNAVIMNGDDAQIKNLKVIIVAGCGTAGARPNIIYSIGKTTIIVDNLYLYGDITVGGDGSVNRQNGIRLSNVDGSHVRNCLVTNNQYYGISLSNDCDFSFVRGNLCYSNRDGISLNDCTGTVVAANTCILNVEYGIHLHSSSEGSVEVNLASFNSRDGIYCLASSENAFAGNILRNNTWNGIHLEGGLFNSITGNTVTNNTSSGIYLTSADSTILAGNICGTNGVHGIYLDVSNHCTVTGNNCFGQTANHGIYARRTSHCPITGNTCGGNNLDGINVLGDVTANADYNTLVGNVCYNNTNDGIEVDGDFGGGNNYANENIVTSNQLKGNGGVSLNDDGTGTVTDNNVI